MKKKNVKQVEKKENTWSNTQVRKPRDYKMFENSRNKNYENTTVVNTVDEVLPQEVEEVDFNFNN